MTLSFYVHIIEAKGDEHMKFFIREARLAANLTQKQLSDMLGITDATLSGYETGNHDPKSKMLVEIAKICNTTTDYLLGLTDKIRRPDEDQLTADESKLVLIFRDLNNAGKASLLKQATYIQSDPDMIKDGASSATMA